MICITTRNPYLGYGFPLVFSVPNALYGFFSCPRLNLSWYTFYDEPPKGFQFWHIDTIINQWTSKEKIDFHRRMVIVFGMAE